MLLFYKIRQNSLHLQEIFQNISSMKRDYIELQPANPDYLVFRIDGSDYPPLENKEEKKIGEGTDRSLPMNN